MDFIGAHIMQDNKMQAVHDNDLDQLLKSLDIYEDVVNKHCNCIFCNKVISLENIDSIVPFNNTVQFTCDDTECHYKLLGWRK